MAKAIEAAKSLESSRQELSGVRSAGCCESRRWNRRGLIWSVAQNHRNEGYKLQGEVPRMPDEKSEETIVPQIDRTTKPVRREGSLLQPGSARK
jgi:hypothetical protein